MAAGSGGRLIAIEGRFGAMDRLVADAGAGLHIEVSDSGGGFDWSEAVQEHPPRPHARRGRGLWIVRQLVDRVTVDRGGGDGTTCVCIDLHQQAA